MIKIPMDERAILDQDVFSAFDLTNPKLKSIKDALEQEDITLAKKELIHYFEIRTNPQFFYDYRQFPLTKIDTDSNTHDFQSSLGLNGSLKEFCLYAGQQLMNNIYVRPGRDRITIDLGKNYENLPHFNYYEDQEKKHRSLSDIFVRGQIFEYLAVLYHETKNKDVLKKFEEILQVFFQNYPLVLEYTKPDASRFCLTEDRDVMSTGWLTMTYISLFYTRIPYEINTDLAFEIIKRIWFLGIQFRRFDKDTYRKYNHHMWERGLVPYMLGVLLPEIPDFAAMKLKGGTIICEHIKDDFNEDGGYSEHSIPYWSGAALCEMLYRGICLSRINQDVFLDEESEKRLNLTFEALALISPPQELYSSIGDNGGPMVDPILHIGVKATDNLCCKEVLELRHNEKAKAPASAPLDYCNDKCGFFASRSGYYKNANFILMSVKINCGDSGHNHMDMLSTFITFRGEEFIGEPYARPLYHLGKMNSDQRGYLYNMESHNTVLVHGKAIQPNSMYANKWGVYRPDSPVSHFESNRNGCVIKAYHDAYTTCRHNRTIIFHRTKGLIIFDEIEHGNRLPDSHIQRWNLLSDVKWTQINNHSIILEKNNTKLLCFWKEKTDIMIWQKEDLYPEIVKGKKQLSTIIDASFASNSNNTEDIGTVSFSLLILDITDYKTEQLNEEQLTNSITSILMESDLEKAMTQFDHII